uniref:Immunoglobulin I-set domain-containing protein n=1 Tax=Panagrolaimus superbus TaxID=310955 RepID=A0A914Y9T4_9BILA
MKLQEGMTFAQHEANTLKDAHDASIETASDKPTFSRSSSKQQKSSKKKMLERHASGISQGAGEYSEAESVQSAVDFALSQSNIIESGNESVTLDAEFSINRGVTDKDAEIFRRHQARQKAAIFKHLRQSSEESISTEEHAVSQNEARASRKGKTKKSTKESTEESISMSKELESGIYAEGAEQKLAEMAISEKVKKHITPEGEKSMIYEKVLAKPDTMQFVVEALKEKLEAADAKSLREPLTQNVSVEFIMDSDRESECSASSTQSSTADTLRAKKKMQESKESTTSVTENIITAPKTLHVETVHRRRSSERSEKTVLTSKEAFTENKQVDQEDAETQHKKSLKAKKVYSEATEETTTVTSVFKLQNKEAATESVRSSKSPKRAKTAKSLKMAVEEAEKIVGKDILKDSEGGSLTPPASPSKTPEVGLEAELGPSPEEESIEVFLSDEVNIGARKRIKQPMKEVDREVDITKLPENAKAKGAISLKETIQMSKSAKVPEPDEEKKAAAIAELKDTLDVSKQPRKKKAYKKSVSAESMHSEYVTASEGYGEEDIEDETFEATEAIKHSVGLRRGDTVEKAEETFSDEEAESIASTVEESKDEATTSDFEITSNKPKVPPKTAERKVKVATQKQMLSKTIIALPESDAELENAASKLAKDAEKVALDSPTIKDKILPLESDEDTSINPQLERMSEQADALANRTLEEREKALKDLHEAKQVTTSLDKTLSADNEAAEEAKSVFKKRPPVKIRKRIIQHEESIYDVEALAKPEEKYETVEVTLKMEIKLQEQKSLRSQSKERKQAAVEQHVEVEEEKKPVPKLAAKAKKLQKHRKKTRHPSSERESEAEVEPEPTTFNFPEERIEAMQTVADKLEEYGSVNAVLAVKQKYKEQNEAYIKEAEKESEDLFVGMRKIGDQGLAEVIIRDVYGTKLDVFKITKTKIQKLDEELEKRGIGKVVEMYIEQSPESDADDEMSLSSKIIPIDNREILKAKVDEMVGGTVTAGKKSKVAPPKENVIKPSFLQKKQRITAKKGQNLVVKLKLMSNPEPKMSIYRNEAYMEEDDRINIIVEKDKYLYTMILMIDSIDQTFEGEITFVATNEHGHDEAKVILNIEEVEQKVDLTKRVSYARGAPKFMAHTRVLDANEGEAFELIFTAKGEPTPVLTLDLDNEPVDLTKICVAENSHGHSYCRTTVRVMSKEERAAMAQKAKETEEEEKRAKSKSPSPSRGGKKKNIPKPLFIPDEIHSRFGDPSTFVSEANLTAKLAGEEASAIESIVSPVKNPLSASVERSFETVKITDAKDEVAVEAVISKPEVEEPKKKKTLKKRKSSIEQLQKPDDTAVPEDAKTTDEDSKRVEELQKRKDELEKRKQEELEKQKGSGDRKLSLAEAKKEAEQKKLEEAKKKADEEMKAKRKAAEEALQKKKEEEERKKKEAADAEAAKKTEIAAKKKEEQERKKAELEDKKRKELEAKKQAEEEARLKLEESLKQGKEAASKKERPSISDASDDEAKSLAEELKRKREEAAIRREEEEKRQREAEEKARLDEIERKRRAGELLDAEADELIRKAAAEFREKDRFAADEAERQRRQAELDAIEASKEELQRLLEEQHLLN